MIFIVTLFSYHVQIKKKIKHQQTKYLNGIMILEEI